LTVACVESGRARGERAEAAAPEQSNIIPDRRTGAAATAQRLLDLLIAIAGLAVLSPFMLLVVLLILIETGRPIFYSQTRIGRGGGRFRIHKFRKFYKDIGAGSPLTVDHDPRMTPVGRFLALSKLDELPQLWNVLVGEMAIVGPRPESVDFSDCFSGSYAKVLEYTPGIFGPSQVAFRDERSFYPKNMDPIQFYRDVLFPVKATLDLSYFPNRTFLSDITWIVRGVVAVIGGRSALGSVPAALIVERPPLPSMKGDI
jgi:lipopolysaccharide/colanic/teichoic acid biosynthesis glycosyltransferase